jgi:hypothetical protein
MGAFAPIYSWGHIVDDVRNRLMDLEAEINIPILSIAS